MPNEKKILHLTTLDGDARVVQSLEDNAIQNSCQLRLRIFTSPTQNAKKNKVTVKVAQSPGVCIFFGR